MMQRYFINKNQIDDQRVIIRGDDYHHMSHVMRFKPNDQVIVNTYDGQVYLCEIHHFTHDEVILHIIKKECDHPIPYHLTLGLSLTKRDAFELALKKATELGVEGFIPLETERSIIKIKDYDKKRNRFISICKESSEQSERTTIPYIGDLSTINQLNLDKYDHLFFAYAREKDGSFKEKLMNISTSDSTLILIGPEGGFSNAEVKNLQDKGFQSISLGQTILRAETAAIYLASVYQFMVGESK